MAHSRWQFLNSALNSLAAQALQGDIFEVILLTGFSIAGRVVIPAKLNIKTRVYNHENMGMELLEGLKLCSGDVVCLLEDDDTFEPNKISKVIDMFTNVPDLILYRNNTRFIDACGEERLDPTPSHRVYIAKHKLISTSLEDANSIVELWRAGAYFNNSTMSFRRSLLTPYSNELKHIHGGLDFFLLYAALLSRHTVVADDSKLTAYRIHDQNYSYTTPALRAYYNLSSAWVSIKLICTNKSRLLFDHSSINLEMLKVFLLCHIGKFDRSYFLAISWRILRYHKRGITCFIRSHQLFGLYSFYKLLVMSIIGHDPLERWIRI